MRQADAHSFTHNCDMPVLPSSVHALIGSQPGDAAIYEQLSLPAGAQPVSIKAYSGRFRPAQHARTSLQQHTL